MAVFVFFALRLSYGAFVDVVCMDINPVAEDQIVRIHSTIKNLGLPRLSEEFAKRPNIANEKALQDALDGRDLERALTNFWHASFASPEWNEMFKTPRRLAVELDAFARMEKQRVEGKLLFFRLREDKLPTPDILSTLDGIPSPGPGRIILPFTEVFVDQLAHVVITELTVLYPTPARSPRRRDSGDVILSFKNFLDSHIFEIADSPRLDPARVSYVDRLLDMSVDVKRPVRPEFRGRVQEIFDWAKVHLALSFRDEFVPRINFLERQRYSDIRRKIPLFGKSFTRYKYTYIKKKYWKHGLPEAWLQVEPKSTGVYGGRLSMMGNLRGGLSAMVHLRGKSANRHPSIELSEIRHSRGSEDEHPSIELSAIRRKPRKSANAEDTVDGVAATGRLRGSANAEDTVERVAAMGRTRGSAMEDTVDGVAATGRTRGSAMEDTVDVISATGRKPRGSAMEGIDAMWHSGEILAWKLEKGEYGMGIDNPAFTKGV